MTALRIVGAILGSGFCIVLGVNNVGDLIDDDILTAMQQLPGPIGFILWFLLIFLNVAFAIAGPTFLIYHALPGNSPTKPAELSESDKLVAEIKSLLVTAVEHVKDTGKAAFQDAERIALESRIVDSTNQARLDTLALLELQPRPEDSVLDSVKTNLAGLLIQLDLFSRIRNGALYYDKAGGTDLILLESVAKAAEGYQHSVQERVIETNLTNAQSVMEEADRLAALRPPREDDAVIPKPDSPKED